MGLIIQILVCVLCIAFVYIAFKHVSYHEKNDNKIFKSVLKTKKNKK